MTLAEKAAALQKRLRATDAISFQDNKLLEEIINFLYEDEETYEAAPQKPKFGQNIPNVDTSLSTEDLQNQKQQILARMEEVDRSTAGMKQQIGEAKARVISDNEYADPHWYVSVNSALRHAGRERQKLQTRLGEVNKILKERRALDSNASDERRFIAAARILLPKETYLNLWTAAGVEKLP